MASLTRPERRRQRRRQQIIDAARTVIAQKGVADLTIADVTAAADVAVGSFYTYFEGKQELLEAAVWAEIDQLGNPRSPELLALPGREQARLLLLQVYAFVESHRDLMNAVFGAHHNPAHFERGLQLVEMRLIAHLAQQDFIPPAAIPWLAALIGGAIAGGIRYALLHPDATAAEMSERTLRVLRPLTEVFE
ncbi:MAG: TetR/AcrR family transcriptional regulator; helix-turn-helix transcriptional regulator [Caldilineales bacterium]|nr:TetR/AcrR family transcriptional regulator; helix-turn-helix transcriptional regulator [Caldilineales bacterium]